MGVTKRGVAAGWQREADVVGGWGSRARATARARARARALATATWAVNLKRDERTFHNNLLTHAAHTHTRTLPRTHIQIRIQKSCPRATFNVGCRISTWKSAQPFYEFWFYCSLHYFIK